MRVVVLAVALVLVGCGNDGGPAERAGSTTSATNATTTTVDPRRAYFAELTALLDETERLIEETPETSGNEGGFLTVATAYTGLAEAMDDLDPPADLRVSHQALVAQARLIAEEAEGIAGTPALSVDNGRPVMGDRLGPGLSLAQHRREFRELVAELAAR